MIWSVLLFMGVCAPMLIVLYGWREGVVSLTIIAFILAAVAGYKKVFPEE